MPINNFGKNNPFYGKHHTKATKKMLSDVHKGQRNSIATEFKKGTTPWNKGKCHSETAKKKMRGRRNPMLGVHRSGEDAPFYGKKHTDKTKRKMVRSALRKWQNPNFIKSIVKSFNTKPNKMELKLNSILQEILPNEYALNVRAEILILGGKVPDFVNINGQKKIVELFGEYWHTEKANIYTKTEKGRIEYFQSLGWDTLIIWAKELRNTEQLKQKILKFNLTKEG